MSKELQDSAQAAERSAKDFLTGRGFAVSTPVETTPAASVKISIYERIMQVYRTQLLAGGQNVKRKSDVDPNQCGLTDAEVSHILGHPSLHRRCAEMRSCGLLTDIFDGRKAIRISADGTRGALSIITPVGIAALKELAQRRSQVQ